MTKITREYLISRFDYDPETGEIVWKRLPPEAFKTDYLYRRFEAKHAGKPAGGLTEDGYRVVFLFGKKHRVHRVAWIIVHGYEPDVIDHINGDRRDNRISNLRNVDSAESAKNRPITRANRSGVQGVSWNPKAGKWRARICANRTRMHLGYFDEFEAALRARKSAEATFGFHANHGRAAC